MYKFGIPQVGKFENEVELSLSLSNKRSVFLTVVALPIFVVAGNAVVLGLPQPLCYKLTEKGIPIEQAIEKQHLRPGSGFLSVNIHMDGPTQVISIKDLKEKKIYASPDDREWGSISVNQRPILEPEKDNTKVNGKEYQFALTIGGLGISLISKKEPEELLYAHFSKIISETVITPKSKQFCISVKDVQVDNQVTKSAYEGFHGQN